MSADDWQYSSPIYLNTTTSGAHIESAVSDFPVLIRLNSSNFDFSQAQTGGEDIRFSTSQPPGPLPYEIERWDAIAQAAEIWVKLPTILPNNNSQHIRMYWGNPDATSESDGAQVFVAGLDDFGGVWHMGPPVNGYLLDATSTGQHGICEKEEANGEGVVGRAEEFDGMNDFVWIDPSPHPENRYTISAWVRTDNAAAMNQYLIHSWPWDWATCTGYALFFYNDALNTMTSGGPACSQGLDGGMLESGKWVHVAVTWEYTPGLPYSFMRVYRNGVQHGEHELPSQPMNYAVTATVMGHWWVNPQNGDGHSFDGMIDEVRVEFAHRGPEWIKLCYENQRAAQTLVQFEGKYLPLDGSAAMRGTQDNEVVLEMKNSTGNTVVELGVDQTQKSGSLKLKNADATEGVELRTGGTSTLPGDLFVGKGVLTDFEYMVDPPAVPGHYLARTISPSDKDYGLFWNREGTSLELHTLSVPRLVVQGDGLVGVGTRNLAAQFSVMQHVGGGAKAGLEFGAYALGTIRGGTINACDEGGTNPRHLVLQSNGGNVAIGSFNPGPFGGYKLAVEGAIGCRELVVTSDDWDMADYVFDSSYALMSLDDLESYIRKEKHLPGIPAAAEVEKDGLNVGRVQVKLLEKIEELTLHLIALQRENRTLKERLERVESK